MFEPLIGLSAVPAAKSKSAGGPRTWTQNGPTLDILEPSHFPAGADCARFKGDSSLKD
jgi:hypothetical protein